MRTHKGTVCLLVFLFVVIGCAAEDPVAQPIINRAAGPANERDTYMARVVWFPLEYTQENRGDVSSVDLERLFQKVNDWIVDNEESISSYTVDVVNATVFDPGYYHSLVVPSGVLITYIPKK